MKSREISRSKIGPFSLACIDPCIGIGWENQCSSRHWWWKKCLHWVPDGISHLETLCFFAFSLQIPIAYSPARGRPETSNYGTGIVHTGNMLSWLSFHNFECWSLNVHISIISPNIWDFLSKNNSSVYYCKDSSILFKENLTVFVNINKKPRYPF